MAGGEGTRLRPITDDIPKPFVRVAGKPVIEYGLERLAAAGIKEVFLTTFYKPWQLIERLSGGSRLGLKLFYSVEDEPLGTAGGVGKLRPFLDDTFVVMSGDVLCDVDVAKLIAHHRDRKAEATMALTEVANPSEFGIVGLEADGRVARFKEKPRPEEAFSNLVNAGIYVLEPSVLELIPEGDRFDFSKNLFPLLLEAGRPLYGSRLEGFWMDVGRPADLLTASRRLSERRFGGPYRHDGPLHLHPTARVLATDVYHDAAVGAHAHVEESILYEGAHVGEGARVVRSILCAGAVVEPRAIVEDAVLGARSVVPAGSHARGARIPAGWTHES